jgi:uncharacterized protein (TIGR00369 family)
MMLQSAFVEKFDCAVSVSDGTAEFSLAITDDLFHGAGSLHGALYFFAMDNAAMLSANSYVTDVCVVTRDFTTSFLRPVAEGHIRAIARVVDRDGERFRTEAVAYDMADHEVGRGEGTFVRSRFLLTNTRGYG